MIEVTIKEIPLGDRSKAKTIERIEIVPTVDGLSADHFSNESTSGHVVVSGKYKSSEYRILVRDIINAIISPESSIKLEPQDRAILDDMEGIDK